MPREVAAIKTIEKLHENGAVEFTTEGPMLKVVASVPVEGQEKAENPELETITALVPLQSLVGLTTYSVNEFARRSDKHVAKAAEASKLVKKLAEAGYTSEQVAAMFAGLPIKTEKAVEEVVSDAKA